MLRRARGDGSLCARFPACEQGDSSAPLTGVVRPHAVYPGGTSGVWGVGGWRVCCDCGWA